MPEQVTYVEANETFYDGKQEWRVLAACDDNSAGHWFCVTHAEHLANNMHKDGHTDGGRHRLAWFCHEHGAEAP